ncbi:glycosyltransferase family 25 protein [Acinetobacter kanungonis]|uniref:glycosyltransferase family 25 protein n=1 Tax=Acinetobacter kanungonis TaxID=2699469 RepID=UPI001379789C|nr:glycosyltransferase family 25 protein [Acinetobacter kanungonis]NCI78483.1 glycosyltransferase family 25 protein [Acinetobacter kanungonis]
MKVFVISIEEENSPRLNSFLCQPFFQNGSLEYTKVGVKGGQLSAKKYFELAVKGRDKPLTPGELGCTLSHLAALTQFLETRDDFALILEDDAILKNDISYQILSDELSKVDLPKNLLLSIGGIQMKECRKVRGEFCDFSLLDKKVLKVVPDFYHRVNYTVSYIVDRKMAKNLLEYHKPVRRADDWSYLYDFDSSSNILMAYLVDHPVVERGESNKNLSTIEAERLKSRDLLISKFGSGMKYNLAKIFYKRYREK